ncbi:hypothetical protein LQF76_12555 [Gloeomargaritales cyanobacterium VI4D9]|nr:hypothetical protein LQF76_12555 [Gloeomargaritales cyanobacterium VI4D9]
MDSPLLSFLVQSLERVASGINGIRLLLEAVDRHDPPINQDVAVSAASWALNALEEEANAIASVLKDHARTNREHPPGGAHQQDVPEHQTLADMVPPERLAELEREREEASKLGKQVLEHYLNRHQQ